MKFKTKLNSTFYEYYFKKVFLHFHFTFSVDKKKTEFGVSASTKTELKKEPKPVPPKPSKKPGQEEPKFVLKPKDKTVVEGRPF